MCVFSSKASLAVDHDLIGQRKVPLTDTDLVIAAIAQTQNFIPLQAAFISSTYILYIIHYCVCLMLSEHLDLLVFHSFSYSIMIASTYMHMHSIFFLMQLLAAPGRIFMCISII